jgi:hypothetical protein
MSIDAVAFKDKLNTRKLNTIVHGQPGRSSWFAGECLPQG